MTNYIIPSPSFYVAEPPKAMEIVSRQAEAVKELSIEERLRNICNPDWHWPRSCDHMIATFKHESWLRTGSVSPTNDYWICQIHKAHYHRWFFNVPDRTDLEHQLNYCVGIRQNHFDRKLHPRREKWGRFDWYR